MRNRARKLLLMLVFACAGVALALQLGGCAQPSLLRGSGVPAPAPYGYTVGCAENPDFVGCGPKK